MARLLWAVVCRRVIVDETTNGVSYIDATWGMTAGRLPAPLPDLWLGTQWFRQADSELVNLRVRMFSPEGKEVFSWEPPEGIQMDKPGHRVNLNFGGIEITGPGSFRIEIDQSVNDDWETVTVLPFEVKVRHGDLEASGEKGS